MFAILGEGEPDALRSRRLEPVPILSAPSHGPGVSHSASEIPSLAQRASVLEPLLGASDRAVRGSLDSLKPSAHTVHVDSGGGGAGKDPRGVRFSTDNGKPIAAWYGHHDADPGAAVTSRANNGMLSAIVPGLRAVAPRKDAADALAIRDWAVAGASAYDAALLAQQYMHLAQALGQSARDVEDMRKTVLATQYNANDLHARVSKLSDHLGASAEEVARLKNELSASHQAQAQERGQLAAAAAALRDVQRAQSAADAAAAQDRHSIAALHQALAAERAGFQTQILQRDAAIARLGDDARHQQRLLGEALARVDAQAGAQRHETEQARARLDAALDAIGARIAGDERAVESLRQTDAQQKMHLSAELHSLQGNMAGEVAKLQSTLQTAQRNMMELLQSLEAEKQARASDATAFQLKLAHMQSQAETMIRQTRESAMDQINHEAEELKQMHDQTLDRLSMVDQRNKRELQLADQFLASIQAKDKETFLERMVSLEGTMRDAIKAQMAAEASLGVKMTEHAARVDLLVKEAQRRSEEHEAVLRDQLDEALRKLRAYAREVEENLDKEQMVLEDVVRKEIKSRMDGQAKLQADVAKGLNAFAGQLTRAEHKMEIVLEAHRQLNGKHEALAQGCEAFGAATNDALDDVRQRLTRECDGVRARLEDEVGQVQENLKLRGDELEALFQNGLGDLQEDLVSKLDKFWDHNAREFETLKADAGKLEAALREDFVASDEGLMSLFGDLRRDHDAAVSRLEGSALKDLADMTQALEDLQQLIDTEKADARQALEDAIRDATEPLVELLEDVSDKQSKAESALADLGGSTAESLAALEAKAEELEAEQAELRARLTDHVNVLREEALRRETADVQAAADMALQATALEGRITAMQHEMQAGFADVKLAEDALKELAEQTDALAEKTATEAGLLRTRVDKLRDELLELVSDEADRRADSIATLKASLASELKDERSQLAKLAETVQVQGESWVQMQTSSDEERARSAALAGRVGALESDAQAAEAGHAASVAALHERLSQLGSHVAAAAASTQEAVALASGVTDSKLKELEAGLVDKVMRLEQSVEEAGAELRGDVEGALSKMARAEDVGAMRADLTQLQSETRAIQEQSAHDMQATNEMIAALEEQAQAHRQDLDDAVRLIEDQIASERGASNAAVAALNEQLEKARQSAATAEAALQRDVLALRDEVAAQNLAEQDLQAAVARGTEAGAALTLAVDRVSAELAGKASAEAVQQLGAQLAAAEAANAGSVRQLDARVTAAAADAARILAAAQQLEQRVDAAAAQNLDGRVARLEAAATADMAAAAALRSRVDVLEGGLARTHETAAALEGRLSELRDADAAAAAALRHELAALDGRLTAAPRNDEVAALRAQLDAAAAGTEAAAAAGHARLVEVAEEVRRLGAAVEEARAGAARELADVADLAAGAASSNDLKALATQVEKLRADAPQARALDELAARVGALAQGLERLQADAPREIAKLGGRLDDLGRGVDQLKASVPTELAAVNAMLAELTEGSRAAADAATVKLEALDKVVGQLKADVPRQLGAIDGKVAAVALDLAQLQVAAPGDVEAVAAKVAALSEAVAALEGDMPSAAELQGVRQNLSALQKGMDAVQGFGALQSDVAALKAALEGGLQSAQAVTQRHAGELAGLSDKLAALASDAEAATKQQRALADSVEASKSDVMHATAALSQLQAALELTSTELAAEVQRAAAAAKADAARVEAASAASTAQLKAEVARVEAAATTSAAASGDAKAMSDKLSALEGLVDRKTAELAGAAGKLAARVSDLEGMVGETDAGLSNLQSYIDQELDSKLHNMDARIAAAEAASAGPSKEQLEQQLRDVDRKLAQVQQAAMSPELHSGLADLGKRVQEVDAALRNELRKMEAGVGEQVKTQVEQSVYVARANLQLQVDQLESKLERQADQVDKKQDERLAALETTIRGTLKNDVDKAQDEKLKDLDSRLQKMITAVANAPVQLNLTPDVKKSLLKDVDKQLAALKADILAQVKAK